MRAPIRVLIVDDEIDLVATLLLRLRAAGFEARSAADGLEGLAAAAAFKPELILLDVSMPRMDGWQFCRRLRADPRLGATPIVLMTAWLTDGLRRQAEAAGVRRTLRKPFNEQELKEALSLASRQPATNGGMRHV